MSEPGMVSSDLLATEGTHPRLSRPLESLVFLLPFIIVYELGCLALQHEASTRAMQEQIVAFHLIRVFFALFGSTGIWMPGVAVVIILLCTQVASKRPWQISSRAVGLMYVEALLLAVPLLAFNRLLRATPLSGGGERDWLGEVVLGIGAGVYEELVFRLALISLLCMLLVDWLHLPSRTATLAAIVLSAILFSAHHHPPLGSEPFNLPVFAFRAVAGLYLGVLFVWRGYGPAAGTHAIYNLLVMSLG